MPYIISDKALDRFSKNHLKVLESEGACYHFAFIYEGSACRDFEISSMIHVQMHKEDQAHLIDKVYVDILPDDVGFPMTCQLTARGEGYLKENFDDAGAVGMTMEAFLAEDRACNPAGCFCDPEHVNHKITLVLLTINYYLQNHD